jgi:hypothetical protein
MKLLDWRERTLQKLWFLQMQRYIKCIFVGFNLVQPKAGSADH